MLRRSRNLVRPDPRPRGAPSGRCLREAPSDPEPAWPVQGGLPESTAEQRLGWGGVPVGSARASRSVQGAEGACGCSCSSRSGCIWGGCWVCRRPPCPRPESALCRFRLLQGLRRQVRGAEGPHGQGEPWVVLLPSCVPSRAGVPVGGLGTCWVAGHRDGSLQSLWGRWAQDDRGSRRSLAEGVGCGSCPLTSVPSCRMPPPSRTWPRCPPRTRRRSLWKQVSQAWPPRRTEGRGWGCDCWELPGG